MKIAISMFLAAFMLSACSRSEPTAIAINTDNCDYCKMTIADLHFAAELITDKGKVYKFDDAACMFNFFKENKVNTESRLYVCDYTDATKFIESKSAFFAQGDEVASPMGGNLAAFSTEAAAKQYAQTKHASVVPGTNLH